MKDPVCGMEVDPKTGASSSAHQGQTYYFCSKGCKAAFDKDPMHYVGREAQNVHEAHGRESHGHA